MIPLLVVIPFWHGDTARVTKLARVLACLEAANCEKECWVMLLPRQDCAFNREAAKTLASKFRVIEYKANSPLRGYPGGANGLFSSAMIHIKLTMADRVETVMWLEPDATPMRPDWRTALINAWRTRPAGREIVGHVFSGNGAPENLHVNGGALYHPEIVKIFPKITICDQMAWDWMYRRELLQIASHSDEIRYVHNMRGLKWEDFGPRTPAIVHGMKDDTLIESIAARYSFTL